MIHMMKNLNFDAVLFVVRLLLAENLPEDDLYWYTCAYRNICIGNVSKVPIAGSRRVLLSVGF